MPFYFLMLEIPCIFLFLYEARFDESGGFFFIRQRRPTSNDITIIIVTTINNRENRTGRRRESYFVYFSRHKVSKRIRKFLLSMNA